MKILISAIILLGIAAATLEDGDLSGIDPAVFDGALFTKDGVSAGAESGLTSSQEAFLKDGNELKANLTGAKVALVGSKAKEVYLATKSAYVPTHAAQVESYLDEVLNRTSDLTVIDKLNVTGE